MDIGNRIYSNVQNCILLKYKCDLNKFCALRRANIFAPPPIPKSFLRPCGVLI